MPFRLSDRKPGTITTIGAIQASADVDSDLTDKINEGTITPQEIEAIKQAGLAKHMQLLQEAVREQVSIVLLQEVFYAPFFYSVGYNRVLRGFGETVDGEMIHTLQRFAHDNGIAMIAPIHEATPDKPKDFNTAVVIDCEGNIPGIYRKILIPDNNGFGEHIYFRPGDLGLPVFDVRTREGIVRVGVYICHDRHNTEGFMQLVNRGAEVIFEPCATVLRTSYSRWHENGRSHARAGHVVLVKSNRWGQEGIGHLGDDTFYGETMIVKPDGTPAEVAPRDKDKVLAAALDIDAERQHAHEQYPKTRAQNLPPELQEALFRQPDLQVARRFSR